MNKIKPLSQKIINLIAAGEVVERPASVLKELIENSIDAGAKRIVVNLEEAGLKLIGVEDDGIGIELDDIELVFEQHATSKISKESDLDGINSMGFRGEAIASISSVAEKITLNTASEKHDGAIAEAQNGKVVIKKQKKDSRGTTISVHGLFKNVPARKKFLKSENTELKHLTNTFIEIALSVPELQMELNHNGKQVYKLIPVEDLKHRIFDLWGKRETKNLIPINSQLDNLQITGFIGNSESGKRKNNSQYIYVNNRHIKSGLIYQAIKQGYSGFIHSNLQPSYFLFLEINPEKVDVNIHPRKLEVKFDDEQAIFRTFYNSIRKTLEKQDKQLFENISTGDQPKRPSQTGSANVPGSKGSSSTAIKPKQREKKPVKTQIKEAIDFTKELFESPSGEQRSYSSKVSGAEFVGEKLGDLPKDKFIGRAVQLFNTYILFEDDNEIIIIDQHAAAEKIQFEKLLEMAGKVQTKPLLIPEIVEFDSSAEKDELMEKQEQLEQSGFVFEDFGGKAIQVSEIPELLDFASITETVFELLDKNIDSSEIKIENIQKDPSKNLPESTYLLLATLACHGSIRAGQKLTDIEMQNLIIELKKLKNPGNCPHGRPTMTKLTKGELEKLFDRVM